MAIENFILDDDGLVTPEVGRWSLKKYELIKYYSHLFSMGMKNKWDMRVYLDLFAGSGRSKFKDTQGNFKIIPASPILALGVREPFDKYIFCEQDEIKFNALKARIDTEFPKANVSYVLGDVNEKIDIVLNECPKGKVLAFCFVDPFNTSNIRFSTIEKLSKAIRVDFLILIPIMDVNRGMYLYESPDSTRLNNFLGNPEWVNDLENARKINQKVEYFMIDAFDSQMKKINYLTTELSDKVKVVNEKNAVIYYLAFYSKNPRGIDFWIKSRKGTEPQLELF